MHMINYLNLIMKTLNTNHKFELKFTKKTAQLLARASAVDVSVTTEAQTNLIEGIKIYKLICIYEYRNRE